MMNESNEQETTVSRRSVLAGISGLALGTTLPTSTAAAQDAAEYEEVQSAVTLTPHPDETDVGGTQSLNGTWDFALSTSDSPPSSSGSHRVAPDLSGTGNDGTLRNDPPVVTASSEQALDLSGESYVAVGDTGSVDFTEPGFTLQLTFKYTGDGPLWSKGGNQFSLGVWGGQLSFWTEGEGDWPGIDAGDLSQGRWYTTTLVVAESEIRLYVDAAEVGSTAHDFSSLPHADSPLHLGYDSGNDDHGAPVVDSFRAYDTALAPARINREFDVVPDDTVAWLSMNDVSGETTPDESGNGNDGTLYNDPDVVPGRDGQGIDLAGDGSVRVDSDERFAFSDLEFAVRTTVQYGGGDGILIDRGSTTGGTEQFGIGVYGGNVSFWMQTNEGEWPSVDGGELTAGEWHTVTVAVRTDELVLFVDGSPVASATHGADRLVNSDAALAIGGDDLDAAVKSAAFLATAPSAERISRGFRAVPDEAILWHNYSRLEDRSVEWRDEDVPGQWGYDGYFVPEGSSEWYPPDGTLGWYRREFEVPDGWDDGRLFIRFDAVYSEARVFLNGQEVGHHVGGYTPFEVDITDAVEAESNVLAVGVSQQSPADDMGWQNVTGGITRDVTLVSVPDAHLTDCDVTTDLRKDGSSAIINVDATVENAGQSAVEKATTTVTLTDPDGESVASAKRSVSALDAGESREFGISLEVPDPQPWNPEQPRLYTINLELKADSITEVVSERIGIRNVEVDGNNLRINGESVTLRGVNWEEIHLAEHGHAVPPETTREDARRLKEANVNYVRAAHHPTSEAFLDACDELGIVVEMEAPHMFVGRQRGDPYPDVVVRQTLEMVERDKNRASVCLWSIANESEWYDVFDTVAALVKERDPTRPTIFNHDAYDPSDPWHDDYDVRAHHYPAFRTGSTVAEHADLDAPVLFDEAAHTYCYNDQELVTDPGLRDEWGRPFELIWERCREADSVAGAAVWAGGDHLEQWGEYLWGLLDRNRRPRPEYWHVKKVYSPVRVIDAEWQGNGNVVKLTIENRHEFVDLTERSIEFDGTPGRGTRSVSAAAGERTTVTIPVKGDRLEMRVTHPEGHIVEQAVFTPDSPTATVPDEPADRSFVDDDGVLSVTTDVCSLRVDRDTGGLEVRIPDDTPLVVDGPELALTPTQGATGRDYANAIDHRPSNRTVTDVSLVEDDAAVAISVAYDAAEGTFVIRPLETGLEVEYEFTLQESVDAREVGVAIPLARELTTLTWARDGQWSVYPATHVGRLAGTASAFPDGSRPDHEEIRIQRDQHWKDDATMYGSNDFRGTKRNVYAAALSSSADDGVCLRSNGKQHVRAQVRSDAVDLLALDRSLSGTNADAWLSRHPVVDEDPTLEAGETLEGSTVLQIIEGERMPSDGNAETPSGSPPGNGHGRNKHDRRSNDHDGGERNSHSIDRGDVVERLRQIRRGD